MALIRGLVSCYGIVAWSSHPRHDHGLGWWRMKNHHRQRKHILIAEDDPDIGNLLQYLLQRDGLQTTAVADGREALDRMFELKPDLLLLDLMLPSLHGFEVCRLLKSAPALCRIPVVILTALASTEDRLKGFKMGVSDYLTKPFHPNELVRRVGWALDGSGKPDRGQSLPRITIE